MRSVIARRGPATSRPATFRWRAVSLLYPRNSRRRCGPQTDWPEPTEVNDRFAAAEEEAITGGSNKPQMEDRESTSGLVAGERQPSRRHAGGLCLGLQVESPASLQVGLSVLLGHLGPAEIKGLDRVDEDSDDECLGEPLVVGGDDVPRRPRRRGGCEC